MWHYISPTQQSRTFLKYFDDTVERLASSGNTLCLLGDTNLDLLKSAHDNFSHDFLLSLLSCYLIPSIDKPTRVYKNSATLIDNIFVSNPEDVSFSGNIISDISDHFAQFCLLKTAKDLTCITRKKVRNFSAFSGELFKKDICSVDWNRFFQTERNNIDKEFSTFYKTLNKIVNKHAPIKSLSKRLAKRQVKPWITEGIRTSIKLKNKFYAISDNVKYKYYRNKITSLIRMSKKDYYHNFFDNIISNMKKTWEGINSLIHRKSKSSNLFRTLKDPNNDNQQTTNPSRLTNILNIHFATIGNRLANRLPASQHSFNDFLVKSKPTQSSFLFQIVTPAEVQLEILSTPNNKAHGLYSCPTYLLKLSSDIISVLLANLINLSISQGLYPAKLKISKIEAVFKSDDPTDPNNYRPISLLSIYNRIFEKLMYARMISFIEKHDLLYNVQYGFRKLYSTEYAILDIVNAVQSNMNNRMFSCGFFINLKKRLIRSITRYYHKSSTIMAFGGL